HATVPDDLRELLGTYRAAGKEVELELVGLEGGVSLSLAGQPPARITRIEGDRFALAGLPDTFSLTVQRDAKKRPKGIVLVQPGLTLELALVGSSVPRITIEQLLARRAAAHRSAALKSHENLRMASDVVLVHQGLRGKSVVVRAAGDRWTEDVLLLA